MCGRFTLKTPSATLGRFFGVTGMPDLPPRYNIARNSGKASLISGSHIL